MREILFRGKTKNGEWKIGDLIIEWYGETPYIHWFEYSSLALSREEKVIPETVGQFTGLTDKNGKKIFEGDIVKFFGMAGKVCFEQGCFGIGVQEIIDWKKIKKQILPLTGCDNKPYFCENDNFVSFWELIWNFNGEDEQCDVCEVIGNIHDNPELLEKDNA